MSRDAGLAQVWMVTLRVNMSVLHIRVTVNNPRIWYLTNKPVDGVRCATNGVALGLQQKSVCPLRDRGTMPSLSRWNSRVYPKWCFITSFEDITKIRYELLRGVRYDYHA